MKEKWSYNHNGDKIEVINSWFFGEKLIINGKVVDKQSNFFSATLNGKLRDKTKIRAEIKSGLIFMKCSLFIGDEIVELQKA